MDCCCNTEKKKVRSAEEKKAIITRLNRITGQLGGIGKMIEEDRYCEEVLVQLSAVGSAVKSLANYVLEAHMHTCLIEHIQAGDFEIIDEIAALIKRFQ